MGLESHCLILNAKINDTVVQFLAQIDAGVCIIHSDFSQCTWVVRKKRNLPYKIKCDTAHWLGIIPMSNDAEKREHVGWWPSIAWKMNGSLMLLKCQWDTRRSQIRPRTLRAFMTVVFEKSKRSWVCREMVLAEGIETLLQNMRNISWSGLSSTIE